MGRAKLRTFCEAVAKAPRLGVSQAARDGFSTKNFDERKNWQTQNSVWMASLILSIMSCILYPNGVVHEKIPLRAGMLSALVMMGAAAFVLKSKVKQWYREDIRMTHGDQMDNFARIYGLLKGGSIYKELDTIERLVVPVLAEMGWPTVQPGHEWRVVRGDRNHNGNKESSRRRFDLNLYKDDERLSVAMECKDARENFVVPLDGQEKNDADIASNKSSLGQLLDELFDPDYGIHDKDSGVVAGHTTGVWTNGRIWVIVKWGLADEALGWNQVQTGLYPRKYFSGDEFPAMKYKIVDLFPEDDCAVWGEAYKLLEQEIGFENAR